MDASGTLGRGQAASVSQLNRVAVGFSDTMMAHEAEITALNMRVDSVESRIGILEDDVKGLEGGIAAAAALGSAIPLPGEKLTLSLNAAAHGDEQAFAGSVVGRLNDRLAIGAGVTGNTGDDKLTAQVGLSIGL